MGSNGATHAAKDTQPTDLFGPDSGFRTEDHVWADSGFSFGAGDTIGLLLECAAAGARWRLTAFRNGRKLGLLWSSADTPSGWSFTHRELCWFCEVYARGTVVQRRFAPAVAAAVRDAYCAAS